MDKLNTEGFVYVATGKSYVDEAILSARSLRKFQRERICLVSNAEPPAGHPFDDLVIRPEFSNNIRTKLSMDLCPYERFIFLDSDTTVIGPLDELFQLLQAFDVCVLPSLGGYHYELEGVPPAFREPSTNLIAFRRGAPVSELFVKWRHFFAAYEDRMGREWDQRSFRHAAYVVTSLRLCFLGDEWSLSPYPGGLLCRDVRVLHGRPEAVIREMARTVNRQLGYRVFWRGLPILRETYSVTFSENIALAWCFLVNALKSAVRPLIRRKP